MLIIFEGIDRVGKTTLLNKISETYNIPKFKDNYMSFSGFKMGSKFNVSPTRESCVVNIERMNCLLNYVESVGKTENLLIDRFHMSEYVYDKLERNEDIYEAFEQLDERIARLNSLIILVDPIDIVRSSSLHGKDLTKHKEEFDILFEKTKCRKVRTNWNDIDRFVVDFVKELC